MILIVNDKPQIVPDPGETSVVGRKLTREEISDLVAYMVMRLTRTVPGALAAITIGDGEQIRVNYDFDFVDMMKQPITAEQLRQP